jgi:hypothetical protein
MIFFGWSLNFPGTSTAIIINQLKRILSPCLSQSVIFNLITLNFWNFRKSMKILLSTSNSYNSNIFPIEFSFPQKSQPALNKAEQCNTTSSLYL